MSLKTPLLFLCAAALAGRVLDESGDDERRMNRMIEVAYGRGARAEEIEANLKFLAEAELLAPAQSDATERRRHAWNVLAQVIVAANEFIYVN